MDNCPEMPFLRVAYTDARLVTMAHAIVTTFHEAGLEVEGPSSEAPAKGVLGTPEILITIIVTAAAKTAIKIGVKVLRQYLDTRSRDVNHERLQVIVDSPGQVKRRFPINLRNITGDAIEEFISEVMGAVDAL